VKKNFYSIVIILIVLYNCGLPQEINNQNIIANNTDSETNTQLYYINSVNIKGNKTTRDPIILRELVVKQGDRIYLDELEDLLKRCKENLLNTSLFNYVTINYFLLADMQINVNISVEERWYTWPIPILEHADRNLATWLDKKDISMINYGVFALKENFRGRGEDLKIKARFGFKEQFALMYVNPNIDRKKKHGLGFEIAYNRQKEIIVKIEHNKPVYHTESGNYQLKYFYADLYYLFRPGIYTKHVFSAGYNNIIVSDAVIKLNPWFNLPGNTKMVYNTLSYNFIRDLRDFKTYPLKGSYSNFSLKKLGFGIYKTSPDLFQLTLKYGQYYSMFKKLYISNDVLAKKSIGDYVPYFISDAMGYENYLRGYEHYIANGQDYFMLKNTIRYNIIPKTTRELNIIPIKKFRKLHFSVYLTGYFDLGYIVNSSNYFDNSMPGSLLYSGGLGIDIVTYYDRIIKLNYSYNKFGEGGFFLHFVTPVQSVFY